MKKSYGLKKGEKEGWTQLVLDRMIGIEQGSGSEVSDGVNDLLMSDHLGS